jgi:hypothetical protein
MIQRHLGVAVCIRCVHPRRFGAVVQKHYLSWQRLDHACAQVLESHIGHIGHDAVGGDLPRRVERKLACRRVYVIDGDRRDTEPVARGNELSEKPVAVCRLHLCIALLLRIPAAIERLGSHGKYLALQFGQKFEAAVEDEADARKSCAELPDHIDHAALLRQLIDPLDKMIGVHRIEKETPKTARPQRSDHLVGEECRPRGLGLIHHDRFPLGVAANAPRSRNALGVGARGMYLTHADVGEELGLPGLAVGLRIESVIRFDHCNVESLERRQRCVLAVVQRHGGKIGSHRIVKEHGDAERRQHSAKCTTDPADAG